MKYRLIPLFLGFIALTQSASSLKPVALWSDGKLQLTSAPLGKKGFALVRLRTEDLARLPLPPRARVLNADHSLDLTQVLIPVNDASDLDAWAGLAHDATGACGSIDHMPLNYRLADTIDHSAPYFPSEAVFSELNSLVAKVDLASIDAHLDSFVSALPSRYHRDAQGETAGAVLADKWTQLLQQPARWTLTQVSNSTSNQKSVVARLEGESAETIVLGAHLDSISRSSSNTVAPGADDDASGIAILTEILRIIETENLSFHRSIELHGYAAEEVGLVGSRDLAQKYRTASTKVAAMMQFDMAYFSSAENRGKIFFLDDYTSKDLQRQAIDWTWQYLDGNYARGVLPSGAASDHKSWWEQGYPTLFAFEDPENDNVFIHTTSDTREKFDDGALITRITQLGLLFISHQAGLKSLDASFAAQTEALQSPTVPSDLYVALDGDAGNGYKFSVSAPAGTAYLEFCPINEGKDLSCQATRQVLPSSVDQSDRVVFYGTEAVRFAAGERWRVYAYDADDQLKARRQFEWSETP